MIVFEVQSYKLKVNYYYRQEVIIGSINRYPMIIILSLKWYQYTIFY